MLNSSAQPLSGSDAALRRMLIVEDMAIVAIEIERLVRELGWDVIGPLQTLDEAVRMGHDGQIDAALLDVNLRGQMVFPAADILLERGIPMIFVTGYSCEMLPPRFRSVPCLVKPFTLEQLSRMLEIHCRDVVEAAKFLNGAPSSSTSPHSPHRHRATRFDRPPRGAGVEHAESASRRLRPPPDAARRHAG